MLFFARGVADTDFWVESASAVEFLAVAPIGRAVSRERGGWMHNSPARDCVCKIYKKYM